MQSNTIQTIHQTTSQYSLGNWQLDKTTHIIQYMHIDTTYKIQHISIYTAHLTQRNRYYNIYLFTQILQYILRHKTNDAIYKIPIDESQKMPNLGQTIWIPISHLGGTIWISCLANERQESPIICPPIEPLADKFRQELQSGFIQ